MRPISVFVALITAVLVAAASSATQERNEKAAIVAVMTIQAAQTQYFSQFGHYATSLRQLGDPDRGGNTTPKAPGLLEPELAKGLKNGYRFSLDSRGQAVYSISAAPTDFGTTGSRTYWSDQAGVIHEHKGPIGMKSVLV